MLPIGLHALQTRVIVHPRHSGIAVPQARARRCDAAFERPAQRAACLGRDARARSDRRIGVPEDAVVECVPDVVCAVRQMGACKSHVKNSHRNQAWSLSVPCEKVLFWRHDTQALKLPVCDANWSSWQIMSCPRVLDELGSEGSRDAESRHAAAQGELGVTCSACVSVHSRRSSFAMTVLGMNE